MDLLIKNVPTSYEQGDVVIHYPEGTDYTGTEESNPAKFTIVENVTLTESERLKLLMVDSVMADYSAFNLPTFRSLSTKQDNIKSLHRRKYQYVNEDVKLKSNAQDKNS